MKQSLIDATVSLLGYQRIRSLVYRASFSTKEVEHFISFSFWGPQKAHLSGDFGLRNEEAEQFGLKCVREYGGDIYKLVNARTFCAMAFSLGKLFGWNPRSSLYLPGMANNEAVESIRIGLEQKLLPLVRPIVGLETLLHILESNTEPFRWLYVNGAIRAAQIAYLARKLGLQSSEIHVRLQPFAKELVASLGRGTSPLLYLDKIVEEAENVEPDNRRREGEMICL